jgi:chromosome segregation ATPase
MTGELQNRLDSVCRKAILLTERYQALAKAKAEADSRIATLESQLAESDRRIHEMEARLKYLTIAHTVNPTHEEIEQSRKVITELVRQIDRCINELND